MNKVFCNEKSIFNLGFMQLASIENDQTLCSFLIHDAMSTFTATDWISWLHLVLVVTFYKRKINIFAEILKN